MYCVVLRSGRTWDESSRVVDFGYSLFTMEGQGDVEASQRYVCYKVDVPNEKMLETECNVGCPGFLMMEQTLLKVWLHCLSWFSVLEILSICYDQSRHV